MPYVDKVGDVVRVTVAMSYPTGQTQEANMHLVCLTAGAGDSRPAIAAQLDSLIQTHIIPTVATTCNYRGCRVANALSFQAFQPALTTGGQPGTSIGDGLPTQCRVLTKLKTELVGRQYRGRVFGFTPTDAYQGTDMHPTQVVQDKWFTVMDTLRAGTNVGGAIWQLCIFHRHKAGEPFPAPTPVTAVIKSARWGTQRRGGDYGKTNPPSPW